MAEADPNPFIDIGVTGVEHGSSKSRSLSVISSKKKKKTWQGLESALATAKEMRGGQEDRLPKWYTCGPTWRKGKMAE